MTDLTPNLKLELVSANTKTWADRANQNWTLIDAAVGTYFVLQNLQGIWENSHAYTAGQTVVDGETAAVWTCQVDHISAGIPTTFAEERAANAAFWSVYSSPARARGAWEPLTSYAINDFVVSGSQYAVCIATHTSTASFANDLASGYWSVLVDLSQVGSQVLPVLSGLADANKFVATNSGGTGYNIFDQAATLALLGASSIGNSLLQTSSQAAARTAINAQVAGSYQAAAAYLAAISGLSVIADTLPYIDSGGSAAVAAITAFGRSLIDDANASTARSTLGLGTAATVNTGTSAGNVPVLDGSAKMPAVDGSQLTNLTATNLTGTVPTANGGYKQPPGYISTDATGYVLSSAYSTTMQITEGIQIFSKSYTGVSGNTVLVAVDLMNCAGQNTSAAIGIFIDGATNALITSVIQFTNLATHQGSLRAVYAFTSTGAAKAVTVRIAGGAAVGTAVLHITEFLSS